MIADWTPVIEALPSSDRPVIIAYLTPSNGKRPGKRRYSIIEARHSGGEWRFLSSKQKNRLSSRVTHWTDKPEPPAANNQREGV